MNNGIEQKKNKKMPATQKIKNKKVAKTLTNLNKIPQPSV
jgi:hypothetical protein